MHLGFIYNPAVNYGKCELKVETKKNIFLRLTNDKAFAVIISNESFLLYQFCRSQLSQFLL